MMRLSHRDEREAEEEGETVSRCPCGVYAIKRCCDVALNWPIDGTFLISRDSIEQGKVIGR